MKVTDADTKSSKNVGNRKIRLPKMAELVAKSITKQIIRGELPEGSLLPTEAILMEEFGVSRPTLREALRVLESESLIVVQRGVNGGARVRPPDADVAARYAGLLLQYRGTSLADVYDVRALLEAPCAAALARRRNPDDIAQLRRRLDDADATKDQTDELVSVHTSFHADLVRLTGNQTLVLLHDLVNHIIDQDYAARARVEAAEADWQQFEDTAMKTHRLLVDMIEAGDAEGAENLWRRHLADGALFALRNTGRSTVLDLF